MSLRKSIPPPPETRNPGLDPVSVAAVQKMLAEARNGKPGKNNIVRRLMTHPVRAVPEAFLLVILIGAALLMLPAARTDQSADVFMDALFTSVSAVCVTGLITVDTATFWTPLGQGIILGLIQMGGFGIMTLATLLALLVRKNIGLRGQLVAQTETHTLNLGDVRTVLVR
jgi:trk system potassium uptake protein TrkH